MEKKEDKMEMIGIQKYVDYMLSVFTPVFPYITHHTSQYVHYVFQYHTFLFRFKVLFFELTTFVNFFVINGNRTADLRC